MWRRGIASFPSSILVSLALFGVESLAVQVGRSLRLSPRGSLAPARSGCWDADIWGHEEFQLNDLMCRKSRPNIGNPEKFKHIVQALAGKQCIHAVALGGSVTAGSCLGGLSGHGCASEGNRPDLAWPALFEQWLNAKYPCAGKHNVTNMGRRATSSSFWADEMMVLKNDPNSEMWKADLVVVETAANDMEPLTGSARTGNRTNGMNQQGKIQWYTELLARQLLDAPKRPALVWLEMSWHDWGPDSKPPHHSDASLAHLPVLQYYDIPQVSTLNALMPFSTTGQLEWLKNVYFNDDNCHPTILGHKMSVQLLGNLLEEEGEQVDLAPKRRERWFSTLPVQEELPAPLYVTDQVVELYSHGHMRRIALYDQHALKGMVLEKQGFELQEDVPGKPGLISTTPGSVLLIGMVVPTTGAKKPKATNVQANLGVLKSYAHMGILKASIFRPKTDYNLFTDDTNCTKALYANATLAESKQIDCMWTEHVSVHDITTIGASRALAPAGSCIWLKFEVLSSDRPENKVKLLDLAII